MKHLDVYIVTDATSIRSLIVRSADFIQITLKKPFSTPLLFAPMLPSFTSIDATPVTTDIALSSSVISPAASLLLLAELLREVSESQHLQSQV